MVGTRIAHYLIGAQLGRGGMGEVYLATDEKSGRKVALKFLPKSQIQEKSIENRFIHEGRAALKLKHCNIVEIYEVGSDPTGLFIAMEWIDGNTLRKLIGTETPLGIERFLHYSRQIADALRFAHSEEIVHRDIKPENIMYRDDGHIKILDFGLARWNPEFGKNGTVVCYTEPGVLVGTFAYMSPEQTKSSTVGPQSDIFSLGIVFYELLTGKYPFSKLEFPAAILYAAAPRLVEFNPKIPENLELLVLGMLHKDPQKRPSAEKILETLSGPDHARTETFGLSLQWLRRRMVGRQEERAKLHAGLEHVMRGKGLLVTVGGEAGIGKTTLVEDFLDELASVRPEWVTARGRSSERLQDTEGYLPILEMLEGLIRSNAAEFASLARKFAPGWYTQLTPGMTEDKTPLPSGDWHPAALKRQLAAFLEQACAVHPIVLFFEDLHWADASTLDLLAYLSTRVDSMRLLILATYRLHKSHENEPEKHRVKAMLADLKRDHRCRDIELTYLTRDDIQRYIELEFPAHHFPPDFPKLIHSKTEGNPFFMVDTLQYLRERKVIAQDGNGWRLNASVRDIVRDLPESIREMIEKKISLLDDDERSLLAIASVQGFEFNLALIAKVLNEAPTEIEIRLRKLDRVHGLVRFVDIQETPGGTPTSQYRFVHVLYQNVLHDSILPEQLRSSSIAVAEALIDLYNGHTGPIASELAVLFEEASEYLRAAEFFQEAAENATRMFAYNEAVLLAQRGLDMLAKVPQGRHIEQELTLELIIGKSLLPAMGYGSAQVKQRYDRAHKLSLESGESPALFRALWGMATFYAARMELKTAREIGEQLLHLAQNSNDPGMQMGAHLSLGATKYFSGEFTSALSHFEQHHRLADPKRWPETTQQFGLEPGILLRGFGGRTLWFLGYPDRGLAELKEALGIARTLANPQTLAFLISMSALAHQMRGEIALCREMAAELRDYSERHGLPLWLAESEFLLGWVQARMGKAEAGIEKMKHDLTTYNATGTVYPYFQALLAEALGEMGNVDQGLKELKGVADLGSPTYWDAEIRRVEGDLLLMRSRIDEAEIKIKEALQLARTQSAKSLELRAAISLSKIWDLRGKTDEAHRILSETYSWFREGFDTADLRNAKTVIDTLRLKEQRASEGTS